MGKWSRKYDACINCGTQRRSHRGKGYCTKCHRPATRLTIVNAWDCSRPETLVGYPSNPHLCSEADRQRVRNGLAAQLQQRLNDLKLWESSLGKPTKADRETVITGSFNFTKAAEEKNAENLLMMKNKELAGL